MERTYTIPLRRAWLKTAPHQRAKKAVATVKQFLVRHMKTENVKLGEELNKALWARGDSHPLHKITVVAKKEEDVVYAEMAGKEFKKKDFSEKEEKETSKTEEKKEATKVEEKKAEVKEEKKEESAAEIIGKAAVANTKKTTEKKATPKKKAAKK